jgi:hypothetical protein
MKWARDQGSSISCKDLAAELEVLKWMLGEGRRKNEEARAVKKQTREEARFKNI